jgi:hypothetical protein
VRACSAPRARACAWTGGTVGRWISARRAAANGTHPRPDSGQLGLATTLMCGGTHQCTITACLFCRPGPPNAKRVVGKAFHWRDPQCHDGVTELVWLGCHDSGCHIRKCRGEGWPRSGEWLVSARASVRDCGWWWLSNALVYYCIIATDHHATPPHLTLRPTPAAPLSDVPHIETRCHTTARRSQPPSSSRSADRGMDWGPTAASCR